MHAYRSIIRRGRRAVGSRPVHQAILPAFVCFDQFDPNYLLLMHEAVNSSLHIEFTDLQAGVCCAVGHCLDLWFTCMCMSGQVAQQEGKEFQKESLAHIQK